MRCFNAVLLHKVCQLLSARTEDHTHLCIPYSIFKFLQELLLRVRIIITIIPKLLKFIKIRGIPLRAEVEIVKYLWRSVHLSHDCDHLFINELLELSQRHAQLFLEPSPQLHTTDTHQAATTAHFSLNSSHYSSHLFNRLHYIHFSMHYIHTQN